MEGNRVLEGTLGSGGRLTTAHSQRLPPTPPTQLPGAPGPPLLPLGSPGYTPGTSAGAASVRLCPTERNQPPGTEGRSATGPRHDRTKAGPTKRQPGLSGATSQAAGKACVRAGLSAEGARLIDCDIIPQEKSGKPHRESFQSRPAQPS